MNRVGEVIPALALVVGPGREHGEFGELIEACRLFGLPVEAVTEYRLVHLRADLDEGQRDELADALLSDPVGGWCLPAHQVTHDEPLIIETGLRPGVTDREGAELVRAAAQLGHQVHAATIGRRYTIKGDLNEEQIRELAHRVLHNDCLLYTSPSPRDRTRSRMPSSA